jgi:hypothetical protein
VGVVVSGIPTRGSDLPTGVVGVRFWDWVRFGDFELRRGGGCSSLGLGSF